MEHLYAPWRAQYIQSDKEKKHDCIFCDIAIKKDVYNDMSVLFRHKDFFIVMNKYPYTPGHFMIIPNFHTDKLEELDSNIWQEMAVYAQRGVRLLKDVLGAKGVNIGMNLGEVSGAGIAEHIHLHLLPRWAGDTNFITAISNTRVYPSDFEKTYLILKENSAKYFNDN